MGVGLGDGALGWRWRGQCQGEAEKREDRSDKSAAMHSDMVFG